MAELTQAAYAAQQAAEDQATHLAQVPLAIGLLVGAGYVVELCNSPPANALGRTLAQLQHQPLFEVLPELQAQGLRQVLDEVARTGENPP